MPPSARDPRSYAPRRFVGHHTDADDEEHCGHEAMASLATRAMCARPGPVSILAKTALHT